MDINADFTRRASMRGAAMAWTPSPVAGVERRMLDRVGDEVARATSIVRYAPASRFAPHTHGGGEEILVLDGVFEDEHGAFPAGTYLRNPPTTRHTPGSAPGCVIFVKLWQFDPADRTQIRLDTAALPWAPATGRVGVRSKLLFRDAREHVRLEHWAAGARVALPELAEALELLVIDGSFSESGEAFATQSWLRLPRLAALDATAGPTGCQVWVKSLRP